MVPTCKNVAPYSHTPLNVGSRVNAPLCNSHLELPEICIVHYEHEAIRISKSENNIGAGIFGTPKIL